MDLCDICKNFSLILLGGGGLYEKVYHLGRKNQHLGNARDLVRSAESCPLCRFLKDLILSAVERKPTNEDLSELQNWLSPDPIYIKPCNDPPRSRNAYFSDGKEFLTGFSLAVSLVEGGPKLNVLDLEADVFADEGTPAAESYDIGSRRPLPSSNCPEAFNYLNNWIEYCIENHSNCSDTISGAVLNESTPPQLPTRIIDVGPPDGSEEPKLRISNDDCGHYAALSHCWGSPEKRPLRTTKETLARHLFRIPLKSLTKTFQDAVEVTRKIGLQYLWIDSLCIIQDSRGDWLQEAQGMGLIYQNARITIAASHARDGSDGLFLERPGPTPAIEIPYIDADGQHQGSMFIHARGDVATWSPDLGSLSKRAWITQEWLLSRRIVFYTRSRLIWHCRSLEGDLETQRVIRGPVTRGLKVGHTDNWEGIVPHYSEQLLTYPTDKLIALQGIVNEMKKKDPSRVYAQGLWIDELPRHLLWRAERNLTKGPEELHIPSWSWASKVGPVTLTTILPLGLLDDSSSIQCGQVSLDADENTLILSAKIVDVHLMKCVRPILVGEHGWSGVVLYESENKSYKTLDFIEDAWLKETMQRHLWTSRAGSHSFILDSAMQFVGCAHLDEGVHSNKPLTVALIMSSNLISRYGEDKNELPGEHVLILNLLYVDSEGLPNFERMGEGEIKRCGTTSFFVDCEMSRIKIR